jgi:hypothetical protein
MPKENKEQKLQADLTAVRTAISSGQLEEATNRLGAICCYTPPDFSHFKEIGDLYWELGFPAMAGRYWYLLDNKTDKMLSACDEFQRSLGNNPASIIRVLDPWFLEPPPEIESKLEELRNRSQDFQRQYHGEQENPQSILPRILFFGCAVLMTIMMFIFVSGIIFIIQWFR